MRSSGKLLSTARAQHMFWKCSQWEKKRDQKRKSPHYPSEIRRNTSDKSQPKAFCKIPDQLSSTAKVIKDKASLGNCHSPEELKETQRLKTTSPGQDPGTGHEAKISEV